MNTQPVEKQCLPTDASIEPRTIAVHSIFYTIQGEGPFVGRPAVFVRLAGCNLQCPFCDTDYTSERRWLSANGLVTQVERAASSGPKNMLVVITGGEPFRQQIGYHVLALLEAGYAVQIETNGTLFLISFPYSFVTIVCSPKTGTINKQLAPYITALKYVIRAGEVAEDGLPTLALGHPAHPRVARPPASFKGTIYVQPMDEKNIEDQPPQWASLLNRNQENLEAAMDSAMKHGYTLGVQLHKYIGKD